MLPALRPAYEAMMAARGLSALTAKAKGVAINGNCRGGSIAARQFHSLHSPW
jgi:hypothetical protein